MLKSFWDELGIHVVIPECTCGSFKELKNYQETEQVYQFLMGLNDTYSHIRSQILAIDPLPSVRKAYAIINQEERQRLLRLPPSQSSDSVTLATPNHPFHRDQNAKGMGGG